MWMASVRRNAGRAVVRCRTHPSAVPDSPCGDARLAALECATHRGEMRDSPWFGDPLTVAKRTTHPGRGSGARRQRRERRAGEDAHAEGEGALVEVEGGRVD